MDKLREKGKIFSGKSKTSNNKDNMPTTIIGVSHNKKVCYIPIDLNIKQNKTNYFNVNFTFS